MCFCRLTVHYILSEEENCIGDKKKGIDDSVITNYVPVLNEESKDNYAVCICGPPGFNKLCEK